MHKFMERFKTKLSPFVPEPVRVLLRPIVRRIERSTKPVEEDYSPEFMEDDVFLVSYPRSGNTWLRYMLTHLHPGLHHDDRDIHRVIPNLDQKPDLSTTPKPRVLKTHSAYDPRYPRVIYLLRDGRDSTYSYYVFSQKEHGYRGSFQDFVLNNPYLHSRWHEHVKSWLFDEHNTPLLCVKYEDMIDDSERELRRVLDFLGWEVSDAAIRAAVAKGRIERMKAEEKRGVFLAHIRLGKPGDWRHRYSPEELRTFMALSEEVLGRCGYV